MQQAANWLRRGIAQAGGEIASAFGQNASPVMFSKYNQGLSGLLSTPPASRGFLGNLRGSPAGLPSGAAHGLGTGMQAWANMGTRNFSMTTGAVLGGLYGGMDRDTSIIGGALMGAGLGRGVGYGIKGRAAYKASSNFAPGYLNAIFGSGARAAGMAKRDAQAAWRYNSKSNFNRPINIIKKNYGSFKALTRREWDAGKKAVSPNR